MIYIISYLIGAIICTWHHAVKSAWHYNFEGHPSRWKCLVITALFWPGYMLILLGVFIWMYVLWAYKFR